MHVLRQNKTGNTKLALLHRQPLSHLPWLQGLLWCSSNCEHDLEALVRIYAMVDIGMYCCSKFLSALLLANGHFVEDLD